MSRGLQLKKLLTSILPLVIIEADDLTERKIDGRTIPNRTVLLQISIDPQHSDLMINQYNVMKMLSDQKYIHSLKPFTLLQAEEGSILIHETIPRGFDKKRYVPLASILFKDKHISYFKDNEQTTLICLNILQALSILHHERRIYHNNLSPTTILVCLSDLTVKFHDWRYACSRDAKVSRDIDFSKLNPFICPKLNHFNQDSNQSTQLLDVNAVMAVLFLFSKTTYAKLEIGNLIEGKNLNDIVFLLKRVKDNVPFGGVTFNYGWSYLKKSIKETDETQMMKVLHSQFSQETKSLLRASS